MRRNFKPSLAFALFLLLADTQALGGCGLTAFAALAAVLGAALAGVSAIRSRGFERVSAALGRAGIYCVAFSLALAGVVFNARLARTRAQTIVEACSAFEKAKGRLPGTLDELVPVYLPEVPRAWLSLSPSARFRFIHIPGRPDARESHTLEWTIYPPFYRGFYRFEERR